MDHSLQDYHLPYILERRSLGARPKVRPLQNLEELTEVYRLTHDSYVQYQYAYPHRSQMLIHYPYFDHLQETTVLVATVDDEIVGTVSYTLDGPNGLTVDEDFGARCNKERATGKRIAAVWRLVVNEKHRNQRQIVTSLIREVLIGLRQKDIESCFFSVNPRHVTVYCKMLNMKVVAQKDITKGLLNAPAILLLGDPLNVPVRIVSPDESFASNITIPILLNIHAF